MMATTSLLQYKHVSDQLDEAGRLLDIQCSSLSMETLFPELEHIAIERRYKGYPPAPIDIFTGSTLARLFQETMVKWIEKEYGFGPTLKRVATEQQVSPFGFKYASYRLPKVEIAVIQAYPSDSSCFDVIALSDLELMDQNQFTPESHLVLHPDLHWVIRNVGGFCL